MTRENTQDEGSPVVLVVDDENNIADLYTLWLEDEYRVRTAYDGEQALELLDATVDVVLLDRRMPGLSGDEVLGRIRERGMNCQVAMVTAVEPDVDILKLDFDDYLTKPVSEDDLRTVIDRLLTRNTFEQGLQEYFALASKKATLESKKSAAELQQSAEYDVLTTELADYRERFDTRLARLAEGENDAFLPYPTRRLVADGIAIGLVAVLLTAIHFGIPDARSRLLEYGSPSSNLLVSYLLALVHANDVHLYGNVAGYLVGAFFTYFLCVRTRVVRWFYLTVPLLLTVLPVGTAITSRGLFEIFSPGVDPVFVGFSSVVAGFVGFSFLALLVLYRTIYDHRSVFLIGTFILLVSVAALLWVYRRGSFLVAAAGVLLVFLVFIGDRMVSTTGDVEGRKVFLERLAVLVSATVFYVAFGLGLFPTFRLQNSLRIDVFGHLIGVLIGFGIALITALISNIFPIRERIRRGGDPLPERLL